MSVRRGSGVRGGAALILAFGQLLAACAAPPASPSASVGAAPTSPNSPPATPTPAATASPVPGLGTLWGSVAGNASFRDRFGPVVMSALVPFEGGLLAVGQAAAGGIAWSSPDGLTWSRLPDEPAFAGASLIAVAAAGPGLVAGGGSISAAQTPGLWWSTDGRTWTRASIPTGRVGAIDRIVDLGSAGILALGGGNNTDGGYQPMALRSLDGRAWTELAGFNAPGDPAMGAATTYGGRAIAGGVVPPDTSSTTGGPSTAFWESTDGLTWTRMAAADGIGSESPRAFAAGPGGLVAVGQGGAWRFVGDARWAAVSDLPGGGPNAYLAGVVGGAFGYAAVEVFGSDHPVTRTLASADGAIWTSDTAGLPTGGERELLSDLATFGDRLVAVGSDGSHGALVLVSPPGPPAQASPPPSGGVAACPAAPIDLATIIELTPADRLRCLARTEFHLRVWVTNLGEGLGGTCVANTPAWLFECARGTAPRIQPVPGQAYSMTVRLHPPLPGDLLPFDRWIDIVARVDDPAATTCRSPLGPADPDYRPPAEVVLGCREEFVITSVTPASGPPSPTP